MATSLPLNITNVLNEIPECNESCSVVSELAISAIKLQTFSTYLCGFPVNALNNIIYYDGTAFIVEQIRFYNGNERKMYDTSNTSIKGILFFYCKLKPSPISSGNSLNLLIICIPLMDKGSKNVEEIDRILLSFSKKETYISKNPINFTNLLPLDKPFYNYIGYDFLHGTTDLNNKNTSIVQFLPEEGFNINTNSITALNDIASTSTFRDGTTLKKSDLEIIKSTFLAKNKNGIKSGFGSGLYLQCQPTGSSDMVDGEQKPNGDFKAFDFDIKNIENLIIVILIICAILFILYLISKFFNKFFSDELSNKDIHNLLNNILATQIS